MTREFWAEEIGSFLLLCTVIGSGIMAEQLAGGNVAVALLGTTLATGAMLFVPIAMLRAFIAHLRWHARSSEERLQTYRPTP